MILPEDVLEAAAKAVTGFDITVRHRKPAHPGLWGCCHQSVAGERFIDLNPFIPDEKYIFVFLHECGHWLIAQGEYKRSNIHELEPDSCEPNEPGNPDVEAGCDYLAERWRSWAKANMEKSDYLMCRELAEIKALAEKFVTT